MQIRSIFLPKTLLGRTILVLVLVVAGTQLTSQWVFERFISRQFGQQVVRVGYLNLHSIYGALSTMRPEERRAFAERESNIEGFQIFAPGTEVPPPSASHQLSKRQQLLETQLQERVSPRIHMLTDNSIKHQRVWLLMPINDEVWIVRWERHQFDENLPLTAIILVSISMIIAVTFGWRLVRRINTPLRAAQSYILKVSDGIYPEPLPTNQGPQEIDALNSAVNKMSHDLKKAETDRALLLAGISHDVRTPLARLRLGLEILRAEKPDEVQDMTRDIEEIDNVIGQFLDFARPGETLKFEYQDLTECAQKVITQFELQGRPVAHSLTPGLVIPMYENQIRRLISNLLENAWRYGKAPIEVHTFTLEDAICLTVLDRGPGIPDNQIDRLRQPFTRLEESRSGSAGSGLGLAIVDRIAAAHDAWVDIRNRKGGGLEVRVRFPKKPR